MWCLIPRPSDLFLQLLHHFSPHRQGLSAPLASFQLLSILTKCKINYCRVENISSLEPNLKPIQAFSQEMLLAWLLRLLDVLKGGEARREKNDIGWRFGKPRGRWNTGPGLDRLSKLHTTHRTWQKYQAWPNYQMCHIEVTMPPGATLMMATHCSGSARRQPPAGAWGLPRSPQG